MNKQSTLPPSIERYILAFAGVIVINIGLLFFLRVQVGTIKLLKDQKIQLENDLKIVNSSEEIYNKYKNDIDEISSVFPSEEEVLFFLQTLDDLSKKYSDDALARFASTTPQPEGDMLYLLFNVSMKTDAIRLQSFLQELEKLPYMTRVLTISMSLPDGTQGKVNVTLNIKLYVKNPFSTN